MSEQLQTPVGSNDNYLLKIIELMELYLNDNKDNGINKSQKIDFQFVSIMILYYISREEQIIDSIHSKGDIIGFDSSSCIIPEDAIRRLAKIIEKFDIEIIKEDNSRKYNFNSLQEYISSTGKTVTVDSLKSKIKQKDAEILKKIIWIIHKIRDSFAHAAVIQFDEDSYKAKRQIKSQLTSSNILFNDNGIRIYNRIPTDNSVLCCDISYIELLKLINELNDIVHLNKFVIQSKHIDSVSIIELNNLFSKIITEYEVYFESKEKEKKYIDIIEQLDNKSTQLKELIPNKESSTQEPVISNEKKYEIEFIDSAIDSVIKNTIDNDIKNEQLEKNKSDHKEQIDENNSVGLSLDSQSRETVWIPNLFISEISKKVGIDKKNMLLITVFNSFFSINDDKIKNHDDLLDIQNTIELVEKISFTLLDEELKNKVSLLEDFINLQKLIEKKNTLQQQYDDLELQRRKLITEVKQYTGSKRKEHGEKIKLITSKILILKEEICKLTERINKVKNINKETAYIAIKEVASSILTRIRNSLMHFNWTIEKKNDTSIIVFVDKTKKIDQNGKYIDVVKFQCKINIEDLYKIIKNMLKNRSSVNIEEIDDDQITSTITSILENLVESNSSNKNQLDMMLQEKSNNNDLNLQNKKIVV